MHPWLCIPVAVLLFGPATATVNGLDELSGRISGMVRLDAGGAATDVAVTITNEATGQSLSVRTGRDGSYRSPPLAEGTYSVRVGGDGRLTFLRTGIVVPNGMVFRQDAVLKPFANKPPLAGDAPACADPSDQSSRFADECGPSSASKPLWTSRESEGASSATVQEMHPIGPTGSLHTSAPVGYFASPARPGTNEFHGAVYQSLGNDVLNARGFFGEKGRFRQNSMGAFVGGPIVKDKTFFSYHYERLAVRAGPESGFGNSVPVDSFRNGDFGSLLTGRAVGVDVLGRNVLEGQVFDPASGRMVRGVPVRDPLPNNALPASHAMRSLVADRILPFIVRPERAGHEFNVQGNRTDSQIWKLDAPSHQFRINHSFHAGFRAVLDFSRTSHPAVRNCGGVDGCRVSYDPITNPHLNTGYFGNGLYEDITTHRVRQRVDWIASANVLNQITFGYDEFHVTGHSLSAGALWQERLWGRSGNGLLALDAGPPALTFTGNNRYAPLGNELGRSGFQANHQYSVANGLTWIRHRHTINVAAEFRYHEYPFRGWANNVSGVFNFHRAHTGGFDSVGNNLPSTGDPFASFLLGQVNSTQFQIPDFPTISERFFAWSVVDEVRVTPDLTLTFGLRFDYQSAIRERDDNMSTFDPRMPNPGAGGRLGAMVFAGSGPNRTGSRTLETPPVDALGPRFGFAYRLGTRSVVRGGYGIHYSSVSHTYFDSMNTLGFRFHAIANDLSNGRRPAYFLDDGFPQANIVLPPAIDPAIGNNTSPLAVTRDRATLARVQQWSLAIQRQVTHSATVDLSYHGNRGSRLTADRRVLGPAANANGLSVLDLGPSVLASRVGPESAVAGVSMPYRGFSRSVAQSLRPFPHMLGIGYLTVPAGNSFYHAFRARLEKRFSEGTHFHVVYAWSKLTGMGAGGHRPSDGLGHGPQNPTDTHSLERGLSLEDVPHRLIAAFTHEIPFFRQKKSGLASKVLGGWALSGVVRFESANPVNIVMANDLEPFLFNGQKRPDILRNRVQTRHGNEFDPATDAFYDRTAFADPGPLRFGNASRTMDFVRGFPRLAEDFSVFKDAWIGQKVKLRLETQFENAFNRVVFCDPNRNWSAGSFGQVFSQCNSPRSIRVGLRLDF